MEDYASPAARELGGQVIRREIDHITNPKVKTLTANYMSKIAAGARDFRI